MSSALQRTVVFGGVVLALALAAYALRDTMPPPVGLRDAAFPPVEAPERAEVVAPDEPAAPVAEPPSFDVVRVAADGGALVAGAATPGASVILRVDGAPVAETLADAAGQFVLLFALDPSDAPQTMTLETRRADGQVQEATDTVILAPRPETTLAALDPGADAAAGDTNAGSVFSDTVAEIAAVPLDTPAADAERPLRSETFASDLPGAIDAPGEPSGADLPAPGAVAVAPVAPDRPSLAPPDEHVAPAGPPPLLPPPAAEETESEIAVAASEAEIAAPAAQAALLPPAFLLREGGAVELSGPAPQPADAVVIDAISYAETGEVMISGRAGRGDPEAQVQLYLDNRPVALAQAEDGAWSVAVPELAPGLYTLRADQLAGDGRVAARFETPFQRAAPEEIARPPARPGGDGAARVNLVTVQPGNSLWRISREHFGEGVRYVQIYNANVDQIRDPDLIYPGQVFVLPD